MTGFTPDQPLIVIGSGLAGLSTALLAAEKMPVILLTKKQLVDSNTKHSQGGIAAVWSDGDSSELHVQDTLGAGSGLCNPEAVRLLSRSSRQAIERLIKLGVSFDQDTNGNYMLGLEGAHSIPRVLHAGGDATGAEIQRALCQRTVQHPNIEVFEDSQVTEIRTRHGKVSGIRYHHQETGFQTIACEQVILATGGAGQMYQYTSNPATATGEGCILAYQAGAELSDLEFFQFHPSALNLPDTPNFLISEAVRGEGAILRNDAGEAFMKSLHPLKDLAPRDIVARAIAAQMARDPRKSVYIDATGIGAERLRQRFPTIHRTCKKSGIDITKDWIPITPVAHFLIGGITTDLCGRTTLPGLYACGENARTGVHGANRLASNSLLECAVFSIHTEKAVLTDRKEMPLLWQAPGIEVPTFSVDDSAPPMTLAELQHLMWKNAGLIRNRSSLQVLIDILKNVPMQFSEPFTPEAFELHAMKIFGRLLAESAILREESRGSHYRDDFPRPVEDQRYSIKRFITD